MVAAARAVGANPAHVWRYRQDRRGEIAPRCPVHALGYATGTPKRDWGYDQSCVYHVAGEGLRTLSPMQHSRANIQWLFMSHPQWLEHLWPPLPGRRHSWDFEQAAGDLLAASVRWVMPSAEILPFRKPPPHPGARL